MHWDSIFGCLRTTTLGMSSGTRTSAIYISKRLERSLACLWYMPTMLSKHLPGTAQAKFVPEITPTWHVAYSHPASKQVPSTEVAGDAPVALIAQKIFQVHLIFELRQCLPGKKQTYCICSLYLCRLMGTSALALLVAKESG